MAKCKRSVINAADASTANELKPSPSLEGVNDFDAAPPHVDKHRADVAATLMTMKHCRRRSR